jgi:hypothetical protein
VGPLAAILARYAAPTTAASTVVDPEPLSDPAAEQPPAPSEPVRAAASPLPAWDAAEADRVLAQLRADLARIEREQHRGRFHPLLARVLADGVAVAESFIANHEREAAAGWDPMKLLRDCARRLVRTARLEDWRGKVLPWEREKPS